MDPTLSLENNFFIIINQTSPWDAFMVDFIGLQYEAACLFCSFVTIDANTKEKGLFIGRKCLTCG